MTVRSRGDIVRPMVGSDVHAVVLREFRLSAADTDGTVARIVDAASGGPEHRLPLLTSIDDPCDVATLRATHEGESRDADEAEHVLLDPFVANWSSAKRYVSRIAEQSAHRPTHYRLAVTESGINDERASSASARVVGDLPQDDPTPVDLLWIGQPLATHAGILVLLGNHDEAERRAAGPSDWGSLISRRLGVRIYDSAR